MYDQVQTDAFDSRFNYTSALKEIYDQLASRDLKAMKFLCTGAGDCLIPIGKVERIRTGLDLFRELENLHVIQKPDNVAFLAELLHTVGRNDLLKKLSFTTDTVRNMIATRGPQIDTYRYWLFCAIKGKYVIK